MATDPNPALRKELTDAIAAIDPQITGLQQLTSETSISEDLRNAVGGPLGLMIRRRGFIKDAVNSLDGIMRALDVLGRDGYPGDFPATQLSPDLKQELDDFVAAAEKRLSDAVDAAKAGSGIFKTLVAPDPKPPTARAAAVKDA